MLPAELFTPPLAGDLILDMAASPGGKTTHLISRSGDNGLVIANDSSQGRIQALRSVLQNWGAVNYAVTRFPAERFGEWFPGTFDKILLDAPCSMQGLRTAESHHSRPVSEKESLQLSRRQRAMLSSAIRALRVGGEVVYSTCTLLPEEDEIVIDAILREFAGQIEVSDATHLLPSPAPGLSRYKDQVFSDNVEKASVCGLTATRLPDSSPVLCVNLRPHPVLRLNRHFVRLNRLTMRSSHHEKLTNSVRPSPSFLDTILQRTLQGIKERWYATSIKSSSSPLSCWNVSLVCRFRLRVSYWVNLPPMAFYPHSPGSAASDLAARGGLFS